MSEYISTQVGATRGYFSILVQVYEALHGDLIGEDGVILFPKLLQPFSYGEMRLKSVNPFDYPILDPNYLHDERDVKIFVEGKPLD